MPDIYQSQKRPEERANRARPGADIWSISLRRQRLQNALSALLVLCIVGLVLFISLQQHQVSRQEALAEDEPDRDPAVSTFAHTPLTLDSLRPMEEYLLDALDSRAHFEPMGDQTPFHREWIKQAAYHLVRAEAARRAENHERALTEYQAALAIFPNMLGIHETVGLIHIDARNYAEAAIAFERALEQAPAFGAANNLGIALLQLDRFAEAEEAFQQAVTWRPDYAAAHYNLASLAARRGRAAEALAHYERYIRLAPEDVNATLTLAGILFRGNHWEEAANLLARADRWSPGSPPVLLRLAQSRAQSGDIQASLDALEAALAQVDIRQALAWTSRQEFDPVRNDPRFTRIIDRLAAGR